MPHHANAQINAALGSPKCFHKL